MLCTKGIHTQRIILCVISTSCFWLVQILRVSSCLRESRFEAVPIYNGTDTATYYKTWKHNKTYPFPVYKFPNDSLPKSEWVNTLDVRCGWDKKWDPPTVKGCVDPRGCQPPPSWNELIYGSYEDAVVKNLDVGTSYWYSCRWDNSLSTAALQISMTNNSVFESLMHDLHWYLVSSFSNDILKHYFISSAHIQALQFTPSVNTKLSNNQVDQLQSSMELKACPYE